MSTILKALKKLEERKAADGRRKGDIAWDILREEHRGRTQEGRPLYLVVPILSAFALLALAWYLIPLREGLSDPSSFGQENPSQQQLTKQTVVPPAQHPAGRALRAGGDSSTPAVAAVPSPSVTGPVPAGVSLTVSGIAYQDNAEARLAIVNDLPVMVGTMIDGFVVEKIDSDRVVFSRHGERFRIYFPARSD